MNSLSRREWLLAAGGAGLVAAACGSKSPTRPKAAEHRIVDAHVHIWSSDTKRFPLADGFTPEDLWVPSFSAERLLEEAHRSGVGRINLIQMTWYGLDHSYILDVIANDPEHFVGTGIIPAVTDVSLAGPDRTMVALSKKGVHAFRVRGGSTRPPLGGGPQWMDHPGFDKMFQAGADHNLALSFLMGPRDLPEIDRMCGRYPETPVILDHLAGVYEGSPEEEVTALLRMAEHKRVMMKVGAVYGRGRTPPYTSLLPLIQRVVAAFGPERCMWESDAPFPPDRPSRHPLPDPPHGIEPAVALIRDHADFLSPADKEQILIKTAEDFFFKRS